MHSGFWKRYDWIFQGLQWKQAISWWWNTNSSIYSLLCCEQVGILHFESGTSKFKLVRAKMFLVFNFGRFRLDPFVARTQNRRQRPWWKLFSQLPNFLPTRYPRTATLIATGITLYTGRSRLCAGHLRFKFLQELSLSEFYSFVVAAVVARSYAVGTKPNRLWLRSHSLPMG